MCDDNSGDTQITAPKKFKVFKKIISFCCKVYLENVENTLLQKEAIAEKILQVDKKHTENLHEP